jgi:hypothetical protein
VPRAARGIGSRAHTSRIRTVAVAFRRTNDTANALPGVVRADCAPQRAVLASSLVRACASRIVRQTAFIDAAARVIVAFVTNL